MHRLNLIAVLTLVALPSRAQMDRAVLTGVVTDPSKGVIAGAKVIAHSAATGIEYPATTNSAGVYTLTGLAVGAYTASVSASGFETLQVKSITLEVGETRTLNPTLAVGSVSSNVTVVDAAPDLRLAN